MPCPTIDFNLPANFYARYWQREPLLIRQAVADFRSPISGDDLAGLACIDEVESRIVLHNEHDGTWQVRHGPFAEAEFAELPDKHWTLLVQAVDHWDADVMALRRAFPAIANWRLDDVMVSYAAEGGGVGPHVDNYDVFLVQGMGTRRWRLGGVVGLDAPLQSNTALRLLSDFNTVEDHLLEPGDALYVPAQCAHWGVAQDECITYSIGFRAPSVSDIIAESAAAISATLNEQQRYSDGRVRVGNGIHPGEITAEAVADLHELIGQNVTADSIGRWFGSFATERKYSTETPDFDEHLMLRRLEDGAICIPRRDSRFAFVRRNNGLDFYADGARFECAAAAEGFIERLCEGQQITPTDISTQQSIVVELLRQGSVELA